MKTTKAISLLQPWASLAVMGLKQIETRSWSTPYRGLLLIHASAGKGGKLIANTDSIKEHVSVYSDLPFGYIIGQVQLVDVVRIGELHLAASEINKLSFEEDAFGNDVSRFAWIFRNAEMFDEPIPATGRLGLWEF